MGNTPLQNLISAILFHYSELCGQFEKVQQYPHDPLAVSGVEERKYTAEDVVDKFLSLLDSVEAGDKLIPVKNREGETVVHLACRAGSIDLARHLIELGRVKETGNNTTSSYKVNECIDYILKLDDEIVKVLLNWKSENIEKKSSETKTSKKNVMHNIADCGMAELVSKLGGLFDLTDKDTNGDTPLHVAIKARHYDTLKNFVYLLKSKSECSENYPKSHSDKSLPDVLNEKNGEGETVLHIAMKDGDVDIVKFLLENGSDLTIKDRTGNTPLHDLVSTAEIGPTRSIELIQASSKRLEDLLDIKNEEGQTVLYVASKHGNVDIVEFLLREGVRSRSKLSETDNSGHSALYQLVCSIESTTDKCIGFVKNLDDEYVKNAIQTESKNTKENLNESTKENENESAEKNKSKRTEEKKSDGTEKNDETMLHVIAANGLTPLVKKFNFVDFKQKDSNNDTALHTAARHKHFDTLKEIIDVFEETHEASLKKLLNDNDKDGETVLHIACKMADVEMIQYLLKKGADLEAQDKTGNTPLHDLVDKAATAESAVEKYIEVWRIVVENAVSWWCSKLDLTQKYKSSSEYKNYQRDAVYYLRSEIPNDQNLSVVQLAATKGLVSLVKEMIWVEGVFVTLHKGGTRVQIDVTNLMPHLGGGDDVKFFKPHTNGDFLPTSEIKKIMDDGGGEQKKGWMDRFRFDSDDDDDDDADSIECCDADESIAERCFIWSFAICCLPCILSYFLFGVTHVNKRHSLLDAILQVPHGNKANDIFQIEPMKQLVRDYWFAHQWWTFIMLTVHLIYMTLYSLYSLDTISKAFVGNGTNMTTLESLNGNDAYLIWPVMLVIPDAGLLLASPMLWLERRGKRKLIKEHVIVATNIDVKDIFHWPIMFVHIFVLFIPLLIPFLFFITTLGAIELTKYNDVFFSQVTSYSVILGWLLTFYWASAFEPVFRFVSALKMIILKDIMSFLFFYIFVLLAYSHGIYIVLSTVPSLSQEYPNLNNVLFELLLVGCGADSRMSSEDIGSEFEKIGDDPLLFKFLFTSYIIVTMVGLLNLIIASMCDSYKKFTETDNQGWRQHSLKMSRNSIVSYFISSKLLHPMFKKLEIIEQRVRQEKFDVGKKQPCTCEHSECKCVKTGHYLIEMNYKQAITW